MIEIGDVLKRFKEAELIRARIFQWISGRIELSIWIRILYCFWRVDLFGNEVDSFEFEVLLGPFWSGLVEKQLRGLWGRPSFDLLSGDAFGESSMKENGGVLQFLICRIIEQIRLNAVMALHGLAGYFDYYYMFVFDKIQQPLLNLWDCILVEW